jgi:hypothetical protein
MGIGACTSDEAPANPSPDAATTDGPARTDTGTGGSRCSGEVPALTAYDRVTQKEVDPDFSCYVDDDAGTFLLLEDGGDEASVDDGGILDAALDVALDAPLDAIATDAGDAQVTDAATDAAPAPRTFHLTDFLNGSAVAGASVDLFWGITADKQPDFTATTDGTGSFAFQSPAGERLYAFRVNDSTTLTPLVWYDLPIMNGSNEGACLTKQEAAQLIGGIVGSQLPDPSKATLVSGVRDCQGREVRGGLLELIDDATGQPIPTGTAKGEARVRYFVNNFPDEKCTFTSNDPSIWAVINAPTNMPGKTHGYTLRFKGRRKTDAAPVLLGQRSLELWPGKTTIGRAYRLTPPPL